MRLTPERDPVLRILACIFPLLAVLTALLMWLLQATGRPMPPCPMLHNFHVACPTCGGTQALFALSRGQPGQALAANPLVTLAALLLVGGGIWGVATTAVKKWRRQLILTERERKFTAFGVAAVILANWIYEILMFR